MIYCYVFHYFVVYLLKDTQGKSTSKWNPNTFKNYEYGNLSGTYIKLPIYTCASFWNKVFKKSSYWQNSVLWISPFCTPYSVFFSSDSNRCVLYGNCTFQVLALSTKKWYSSFVKSVSAFQKTCFRVWILKIFKISSDCLIKTCLTLKWRAI